MRLKLEMRHCALRRSEIESIEDDLHILDTAVSRYSIADLTVTVSYRQRCEEFHVRARLVLPGRIVLSGEHDTVALPAFDRCLRKLARKLESRPHLRSPGNSSHKIHNRFTALESQSSKFVPTARGRMQAPWPPETPQADRIKQACDEDDFDSFCNELAAFEPLIRERVGEWVRRYSDTASTFGDASSFAQEALPLDDLIDEVFLTAFDRYAGKPRAMDLADWLGVLVDPAMRSLLRHPDEELEAIGFARTLQEMHDDHFAGDCDDEVFDAVADSENARRNELFRRPR